MVDIVRCVLVFAEDARHVREIVTAPFGIGSGHLGLAVFSHVLNIVRRRAALGKELDDLRCGRQRFVPFAVVEAGVIDVVPVAVCIPGLVRVHWVLLLHAAERKLDPLLRRAVVFFQEFHIAVHQIHLVRDPHGGIAPAHAVLTDVSVTGRPGQRHSGVLCLHCFQFFRIVDAGGGREGDADLTGGVLLDALVAEPLLEKLLYIHEIRRRAAVDHGVARPGVALPGGAVHRHVQEVALLAPTGVFHELIDEFIGAAEVSRLLHVGVDGDGLKVCILDPLHKGIPEAEYGEVRGVLLDLCTLADVGDLLKFRPSSVTVCGGEAAVLIQPFPMLEMHGLPTFGIAEGHMDIARDVLPEVDDKFPAGITHGLTREALLFPHGNALILDPLALGMLSAEGGFLPAVGLHAGVIDLALLQIRPHDGAETDLPALIRGERFLAAVRVAERQLAPERQSIAKVVVPAPPAVAHRHAQLVAALLQECGNVVFLHLDASVVAGQPRCELVFGHAHAIELRVIDSMSRQAQKGAFDCFMHFKVPPEYGHKARVPVIARMADPLSRILIIAVIHPVLL